MFWLLAGQTRKKTFIIKEAPLYQRTNIPSNLKDRRSFPPSQFHSKGTKYYICVFQQGMKSGLNNCKVILIPCAKPIVNAIFLHACLHSLTITLPNRFILFSKDVVFLVLYLIVLILGHARQYFQWLSDQVHRGPLKGKNVYTL